MSMSIVRARPLSARSRARAAALCALLALTIGGPACGGGGRSADSAVAGGDAGAAELDALNYEVTPDRYQRWVNAQRALDAIPNLGEPPALDPDRFSDADVDRAARYLESDARARAALQRSGLSARDYVLTTLALDQALVAAGPAGSGTAPAAAPGGGSRPTSAPSSGSGGARPRDGERATAAAPGAPSGAPSGARSAAPASRTRPRYRNVPPANREIVERNRDDISRLRTESRFRIVKERVDTVVVDRPVEAAVRSVPAGTTISLRSDSRVCTNTHKPGDRVTATVTAPVSAGGGVLIPAGASTSLSVAGSARSASQTTAPMEFTLNSISVDGRTYAVAGTAVASRVDRVRAGSARRDAEKVVGGAAIGAVAGQVLGRDTKSTVVGAAVGAAAGAAAASASARYDACVPAGAPIQLTLRDALDLRV